jgi:hypothetical protein
MRVPEATFRGPEADRRVREVPAEGRARVQSALPERVRHWNAAQPTFRNGRLERDAVGNVVPADARMLERSRLQRVSTSYTRVQAQIGRPANYFVLMPRYPSDYWDGYWDGYRDGRWDGRRHVPHRPAVVVSFYYGYYYSDPLWFGFYYPGYYPSVYHYWGYCPGWVYPNRVYVYPTEYVYVPATPYRYYGSYSVDYRGAEQAIGDIRDAWLNSDTRLVAGHLTDELDIQVYFDGEYEYTTSTDDYYAMTADAMATTSTIAMDFDDPIFISSAEAFYTGRHVFYDPDGHRQTVYVSYRLRRLGRDWYIIAVGSSLNPIRHQYHDFRYN